jgi:hypothetical protein
MDWVRGDLRQVRASMGSRWRRSNLLNKGAEIGWLQICVSAAHLVALIARRLDE